ncbi:hypothetical protein, partial [Acinetobacter baumannii]|uniref:hypothetical protein n=1 Tax=Acinetobacter baumannii TaxID=470 RepID=UPI002893362C
IRLSTKFGCGLKHKVVQVNCTCLVQQNTWLFLPLFLDGLVEMAHNLKQFKMWPSFARRS